METVEKPGNLDGNGCEVFEVQQPEYSLCGRGSGCNSHQISQHRIFSYGAMDTSSKYLVETLLEHHIDTYFGIPGGPIGPMFDAVYRTLGTTLIESRHETASLFEAIGYYQITGKIPVVLATAGPGITNCLTGMASAKALRVPLIVICGDVSWEKHHHILLQSGGPEGIDIEHTFAPHTEKVLRMQDPTTVSQQVIQFLYSRAGLAPLLIVYPLHVNKAQIDKPIIQVPYLPATSIQIDPDIIFRIDQMLVEAHHPLIVVGYGARHCQSALIDLVDRYQIPVATTPHAKGLIPTDHPLSLGHGGLGASQWVRKYVETVPDVVLVLGTDLDDCAVGTTNYIGQGTKLIHVDTNPQVFNRKYHAELPVIAELSQLIPLLASRSHLPISLEDIRQTSPFEMAAFAQDNSVPIAPHRVLADLQAAVPPNVRFVTDIGEHMLFCLHYLTITAEMQFSIDLGLGSMGSGICQAIGMCLGDRRPTICICGDGCFQMHGMEVLTAIQHELPIIFVVFNDARYNMVSRGFKFSFGLSMEPGKTAYLDLVQLASSLGISGYLIARPGQITPALIGRLFQQGKLAILDVRIDKTVFLQGAGRNEVLRQMGEQDG